MILTTLMIATTVLGTTWIHGVTDKDSLTYTVGEPIVFTLNVRGDTPLPAGTTISWKRTGDDGIVAEGVWDGTDSLVVTTALKRAGFVRLTAVAKTPGGADKLARSPEKLGKKDVFFDGGAAADVAALRQSKPEPTDYEAFWAKCRAELASVPIKAELREIPSPAAGARLYEARIACPGGTGWTTGFLSVPTDGAKVKAVASFAGYGASWGVRARTPPTKVRDDEIHFRVTAHGFDLGRDEKYYAAFHKSVKSNGYGHGFDPAQNARPETCYFHGMALRVMRAVEYLKTRPEWNGRDLVVTGGSQASLQSVWCAAFVPGVSEANISIPWLCDVGGPADGRNHGAWYPEWAPGLDYFDQVNAAKRVPKTCRVTISRIGLGDYTAPPCGATIMYAALACPKSATWVQGSTHGYTPPNAQKTVRSSRRPEIAWSVMHPIVVEPDYMRRLVAKAKEYGDVDSFEICGECNQKHGGLNGLMDYAPYPKTAAAVDRKAVADYRRKLRETIAIAHAAGKSVHFWHREGFMPKTMLEDAPGLLDEDGEYDLLGKTYLDFVRWKVREAFRQVPELDGIVLTLTEADFSVIHNSRPERYPPAKVVETIARIFLEEHRRLGKRMIFRSFGSIESDYRDLIVGANACADDFDFEIETKITPYDFSPFLPANPYLKKTSRATIGAECDCLGEYLGAGYLPAVQVDAIARYVGYGRAADVDRYAIRIDRVGNSIFDSAQEANLFAYMRLIRDPSLSADRILDAWAEKRWPRCKEEMKALAKKSFRLVEATQFIDHNVCFHQNPPPPSFKYVKFSGIMGVFRDGMDLHMTAPMWGMMTSQKTPGRAAIRAEKAEAERIAVEGLAQLESLKDRLDPAEYARQHRAWSIAAKSVPAMRAYYDCVCAYFDDMDRTDAEATTLRRAIDAAERVILPRMKSKEIDLKSFNMNACRARGEDLDRVYFVTFLWLSRELLNEYRAEFAARKKLLSRKDVVDFVIPGGIYDDVRVRRVMHSSYQNIDSGVPVRIVGNAAFPNGTITVEFRDVPGARVVVDLDRAEPYADDCRMTESVTNGIRTVTIAKKGVKYPAVRSIALVADRASGGNGR